MENKEKILISIDELPPRSEKLSSDETSQIFGGFGESGSSCDNNCGCVSNHCIIEAGETIGYCE